MTREKAEDYEHWLEELPAHQLHPTVLRVLRAMLEDLADAPKPSPQTRNLG